MTEQIWSLFAMTRHWFCKSCIARMRPQQAPGSIRVETRASKLPHRLAHLPVSSRLCYSTASVPPVVAIATGVPEPRLCRLHSLGDSCDVLQSQTVLHPGTRLTAVSGAPQRQKRVPFAGSAANDFSAVLAGFLPFFTLIGDFPFCQRCISA